MFQKAVPFAPLKDVQEFITTFVCEKVRDIDIISMQENIRHYRNLERNLETLKKQLESLGEIDVLFKSVQDNRERLRGYQYLLMRIKLESLRTKHAKNVEEMQRYSDRLLQLEEKIAQFDKRVFSLGEERLQMEIRIRQTDVYLHQQALDERIAAIRFQIQSIRDEAQTHHEKILKNAALWENLLAGTCLAESPSTDPSGLSGSVAQRFSAAMSSAKELAALIEPIQEYTLIDIMALDVCDLLLVAEAQDKLVKNIRSLTDALDEALERVRDELDEQKALERQLSAGVKVFPPEACRLRDSLSAELTRMMDRRVEVHFLAEKLEIRNLRWQNVIEGYLSHKRMDMLVEPTLYERAASIFKRLCDQAHVYRYGLADAQRIGQRGYAARQGSLATEVEAETPDARVYVDYLLGRVMKAESQSEMRMYDTAVMDDGSLYQGFSTRSMDPKQWQWSYIGSSAFARQLELVKQKIVELTDLDKLAQSMGKGLGGFSTKQQLHEDAVYRLEEAQKQYRTLRDLLTQQDAFVRERDSLDLTSVAQYQDRVGVLGKEIGEENKRKSDCIEERGRLSSLRDGLQRKDIPEAESAILASEAALAEQYEDQWREEVGEKRFILEAERRQSMDYDAMYQAFSSQESRCRNQLEEAKKDLSTARSQYNAAYRYNADINAESNDSYRRLMDDYQRVQLPKYEQDISDAKKKALDQFHAEFLNELFDRIRRTEQSIDRVNTALRSARFGHRLYRFKVEPNADYQHFYRMITDTLLESPLGWDAFYVKYERETEELFRLITESDSMVEGKRTRGALLTDYKTYLRFDLEEVLEDGTKYSLSKTHKKKSGGETQTPFYIAVLASFAQVYRVKNAASSALRLIVFDEAFSKMDGTRIQESIQLLRDFELQAVLAAPPGKVADITPFVDNNLVVVPDGTCTRVKAFTTEELLGEDFDA